MNRQDDIYGERGAPGAGRARGGTGTSGGPSSSQGNQGSTDPALERVTGEARQTVGQVAEQGKQQASSLLSNQVNSAADRLASMADTFRTVSQQSRENGQEMPAEFANRAGTQVERVANYLREKDVDDLIGDAEGYARRQPALFLGGAFALGLLAARFFKSSSERARAKRGYGSSRTGRELAPYGRYGTYEGYPASTGVRGSGMGTPMGTSMGTPIATSAAPTAAAPPPTPRTMMEETPQTPRTTFGTSTESTRLTGETGATRETPPTTGPNPPGSRRTEPRV